MDICFAKARPEHLDQALALCRRVAAHLPGSGWCDSYPNREILASDIAGGGLYRVLVDGRWLGLLQIRSWADFMANEEAPDPAHWDPDAKNPCAGGRFCVDPSIQHTGMGRTLLRAALSLARSQGYDSFRFHAADCNEIALHLYDTEGFQRTGVVEEYGMRFICYQVRL